ncbi:hypothetical protein [Acinetobacter nosocomialis]|uniref:hypothetical protein n=1 Tax=Acinetobacter nosocomialis TaxID=106654 RepID=UPI000DEF74F4|nr:hypothetical protein [Acinetobacter nosocomialis]
MAQLGALCISNLCATKPKQTITAYGEEVNLKIGMLLEADIKLEKRKIYEWILEPLYTVTGNI